MTSADPSFRKINYLVRPTKQVERRLITRVLSRLPAVGYPISEYRYLGLGSVYFADFMLFHKTLHIDDMWCVEAEDVPLAMEFNKPFEFIQIFMDSIAGMAPAIERDRPHVVWLDYDGRLTDDVLDDIGQLIGILERGSIFLVTVNATPPRAGIDHEDEECRSRRLQRSLESLQARVGRYRSRALQLSELNRPGIARLYQTVIRNRIASELVRRPGDKLRFYQLFSYRYADDAPMFTFGGVLDRPRLAGRFRRAGLDSLPFVQMDPAADPIEISVPMLTLREKQWLEQNLGADPEASGIFELGEQAANNFRRFYREYPNYNEVVF
jgi:hypothetical protein